jgi:lysine decarboxylase
MKPLDNLCHPVSVIKESAELAADAFGAKEAFFIVGGTTGAVQAMIMSVCKTGDKIIMPRNVHRSAINALILSGAVPVYVDPGISEKIGIGLGMSAGSVEQAILSNPDAKAVLVNNPTYYGICPDIKGIAELTRRHGMYLLADEAHGTHFYFTGANEGMPPGAMRSGGDMSAVSMHKTGGSLTQSSLLLCGEKVNAAHVGQIINLTQTTSGSYLLMASLDLARKNLALNGEKIFAKVIEYAEYARSEINKLGGYCAFGSELCDGGNCYAFDRTKLSVNTLGIGLAGIEVYDILRDEYGIQAEFGDLGNLLAIMSAGDRPQEIERLIAALSEIKRTKGKEPIKQPIAEYIEPKVVIPPKKAFYADKKSVPLNETAGKVSGEFVMCYPPGIPILAPGEEITEQIIEYIRYAKEKGCFLTGTEDVTAQRINTIGSKN